MAMTKKIQFHFPEDLLLEMSTEAKREKISMAELVRRAVEKYLKLSKGSGDRWKNDPLNKAIGSFDGEKELSKKVDHYLYGIKK